MLLFSKIKNKNIKMKTFSYFHNFLYLYMILGSKRGMMDIKTKFGDLMFRLNRLIYVEIRVFDLDSREVHKYNFHRNFDANWMSQSEYKTEFDVLSIKYEFAFSALIWKEIF